MNARSVSPRILAWGFAAAVVLAGGSLTEAAVTNLAVQDTANAADWSVQQNLQVGNTQYGDRAFTFTAVPASVAGSEWIRTANDSKAFTGATLVTFTVTTDSDVYVAHNDTIGTKPSWLSSWTDSGANLVNNEGTPRTFSLFRKSFPAGSSVALGNNGNTSSSSYTVVVKATATATPTATATATATATVTATGTPTGGCVKLSVPASAVTASTNDGNVPGNTVDGSLATRWSGSGDGAWLQLDLGSVRDVTRVSVAAYRGNERRNRFDVQYSTGGGTWITALAGAQTSGTTLAEESFDFSRVQARYLRYVGHGATLNAGGTSTWNSVVELSAWVALPAP